MSLIDQSYFIDDILIPTGTLDDSQEQEIIRYINQYEPIFLKKAMGYNFYLLFQAGLLIIPVATRFTNLMNGCIWTDKYGNKHEWAGLRNADAHYVYFFFQRNRITQTAMIGGIQTQTDNSVRASMGDKLVYAWKVMRTDVIRMWEMLRLSVDTSGNLIYPEFSTNEAGNQTGPDYCHFNPVNTQGI